MAKLTRQASAEAPPAAKPATSTAKVTTPAAVKRAVKAAPPKSSASAKPAAAPRAAAPAKPVVQTAVVENVVAVKRAPRVRKPAITQVVPPMVETPAVQVSIDAVANKKPVKVNKVLAKKAAKKTKLIRDSFTFPETDYALIAALKQRVIAAGVEVKKSELIRAALIALAGLSDEQLLVAVNSLEKIKTGRPAK